MCRQILKLTIKYTTSFKNEIIFLQFSLLTCLMFLLRPTLLLVFYGQTNYFSTVLRTTSVSVYCNPSVYTVPLCMCGASTFTFKFLQINRYAKWSGHETCSSWSCDRNFLWFSLLRTLCINTYRGTDVPVFQRCVAGMIERAVRIISIIKK